MKHPLDEASDLRALGEAKRHFFIMHTARPPLYADTEVEHEFMLSGSPVEAFHGGERLEVRSWGRGPTVLFVHGMYLSGGRFRKLIPAVVAAGMRAVAFDAPGHGASPGAFIDIDDVSNAILTVAEVIGPLSALVAHSMGVAWALRALDAGLLVPKVVCLGAPLHVESVDFYLARVPMEQAVEEHLRRLAAVFVVSMSSLLQVAGRLKVKALVVHDHDDPFAPFSGGQALGGAIVGSHTLWTSRLGHFKTLTSPDVHAAMVNFLGGPVTEDSVAC